MTETEMSFAEARALIGEKAWRIAKELAEAAPPFSPQQEARLAVILRRDSPVGDVETDAA